MHTSIDPAPRIPDPAAATQPLLMRLGPGDLQACLDLDALALGGFWSAESWRRELAEERRTAIGLRLEADLLAMACGALVLDELHITLVAVDPDRRRLGFGLAVLQGLLASARDLGAGRATLEVAAGNAAAQALYARCGFRTAGVRRHYYRDGGDALIQWCRLDGDASAADTPPPA